MVTADCVQTRMSLALCQTPAAQRILGAAAVFNDVPDIVAEQDDGIEFVHAFILV